MKEKDLTRLITNKIADWDSCALEIKLCKGNSIPFSALALHQGKALWHSKHGHIEFKIPDMGYQNPFDVFHLKGAAAWVCVVFYDPHKTKEAIFIDIDAWIWEEQLDERKSLTLERAREIGTSYFL